jgi:hypothetical protein
MPHHVTSAELMLIHAVVKLYQMTRAHTAPRQCTVAADHHQVVPHRPLSCPAHPQLSGRSSSVDHASEAARQRGDHNLVVSRTSSDLDRRVEGVALYLAALGTATETSSPSSRRRLAAHARPDQPCRPQPPSTARKRYAEPAEHGASQPCSARSNRVRDRVHLLNPSNRERWPLPSML